MDCITSQRQNQLASLPMNLFTLQPDQYSLRCLLSAADCVWLIVADDDIDYILPAPKLKNLMIVEVQTKGVVAPIGLPDYLPDEQIDIVVMTLTIDVF